MPHRLTLHNGIPEHDVTFQSLDRYPGYRFGNDGRIWSQWQQVQRSPGGPLTYAIGDTWRELKPQTNGRGYHLVFLAGRKTSSKVHHLILEAFIGPRPNGMQCRHLDGNRSNNRLDNLAWGTPRENIHDSFRHGTRRLVATAENKELIRRELAKGATPASLARQLNASHSCLSYLVKEVRNEDSTR
jgi:hypothetical protein